MYENDAPYMHSRVTSTTRKPICHSPLALRSRASAHVHPNTANKARRDKALLIQHGSFRSMNSLVILNGSPRKNGNTSRLITEVTNAVATSSAYDVHVLQLNDFHIKPCQACDWCMKEYPLACRQQDDMNSLYPYVLEADTIVFASPIYWFNYSAQLKLFIDRLYALHVEGGHALRGKKFAALFVYGDTDEAASGVRNAIGSYTNFVTYLHGTNRGIVSGTAWRLGDAAHNPALLADVKALSAQLLR
jgi:multimeric flavodoxin WrbA